jgi:uncharacterized cupredoxin-like copper-binding protein
VRKVCMEPMGKPIATGVRGMAAALLVGGALLGACQGEDRPTVEIVSGTPSDSTNGTGTGTGTGIGAEPGVVTPKPGDAVQVDVALREWAVEPAQASVKAGKVYFFVTNAGPEDPHEFVAVRTDLAPDKLPVGQDKRVPEEQVDILDEIEPYAPGTVASLTVALAPGTYAFICNIAESENGEIESHYLLGMRVGFTVTQ